MLLNIIQMQELEERIRIQEVLMVEQDDRLTYLKKINPTIEDILLFYYSE